MEDTSAITHLFGSRTRVAVLRLLLAEPPARLHVREIVRRVASGPSSVQRELRLLESIGLVASEREGNSRFYRAVDGHALSGPLRSLLAAAPIEPHAPALNPRVAPAVPRVREALARYGVVRAAVFGSGADPDPAVVPADLDLAVRFADPDPATYADRYFGLLAELEAIMGMRVDIVETDALSNPYMRAEIAATEVVVHDAA